MHWFRLKGGLDELPQNAVVGTGSKRRGAQLLHHRPDLEIKNIRETFKPA